MIDKLDTNQHQNSKSLLARATVVFVRLFGSWTSIIAHTLIFVGWFVFNWNIERLLVIVSIEAIYIGIFILMAENIETAQRDRQRKLEHQKDMAVVKQDVAVDKKSLKELQDLHLKIDKIEQLIKNKK
jgi:uncharacterized membrane protein